MDPVDQEEVMAVIHGIEVIEIQEDYFLGVLLKKGVNLLQPIPYFDAKQAVYEVNLLSYFPRFGRYTKIKVADPTFQLLFESQILSHWPFLHDLFNQGNSGQTFDGCGLVWSHRRLLINPVAERIMWP